MRHMVFFSEFRSTRTDLCWATLRIGGSNLITEESLKT